jgi:hypothetical protein
MNKRGVYFTALAVIFVGILFTLYTFQQPQQRRDESFVLDTRMYTMNHLVKDIGDDASRMISVATYRALVAMEEYIADNTNYLPNVSTYYRELVLNGTLNGTNSTIMENNSFSLWMGRMQDAAADIGLTLNLSMGQIVVDQLDPWNIAGFTNITIILHDSITNATWNVTRSINGSVSVFSFEDPVYRINTLGRVLNTIIATNVTTFVSGTDTSALQAHANNSYYRAWTGAPSFLQRLEGKLSSSSQYGIESLVSIPELQSAGMSTDMKSIVDYIYFSASDPTSCTFSNTPSWLRLDGQYNADNSQNHTAFYQAQDVVSTC